MIIGFPRALIYWKYPGIHFWKSFFEELGIKTLISPLTNKDIINQGIKTADSETCFSVKVFFSHIFWLDKKVSFIFVPRLIKDKFGLEYCPRFFGLPDIVSLITETSIISPWIDLKKDSLQNIAFEIGKEFCEDSKKIKMAIKKGLEEVAERKEKKNISFQKKIKSDKRKIIIISHPYNLYDDYVNLRLTEKLIKLGIEPIFIDEVPAKKYKMKKTKLEMENSEFPNWHWEFGQEITSQVREIIKFNLVGAIEISSFQCGCDAVLKEFVEKEFKQKKIPFLYLLIDEHTAEAGIQTRLEAFVDTLH